MINFKKFYKAANNGFFYLNMKVENEDDLWKLQSLDFVVTPKSESKKFPKTFNVSWEHAVIKCEDISIINENLYKYTLPEKLWIITQKQRQNDNQYD